DRRRARLPARLPDPQGDPRGGAEDARSPRRDPHRPSPRERPRARRRVGPHEGVRPLQQRLHDVKTARLLGLVVALLAITTVASPVVANGLHALGFSFRFSRIYNRVFEVLLVVALALAWRRLDLGGPTQWGLREPGWRRDLALGLVVGGAGIGLGLVAAWLGGGILPDLRFDPLKTVRKAALGLLGAVLIGVGEETLFRGILLRRLTLDVGTRAGLLVTTALYAVVHGLRGGGKVVTTGWLAGWART